jgi:hypothetical protein
MSHLGGMRTRLPDYSIGATVLVVAIALPFFIFTRAEHLHRIGASRPPAPTPSAAVQAVVTTPDPPLASAAPQAVAKASATPRPATKQAAVPAPTASSGPTSAPTSAPTSIPAPGPDAAPVAVLALTSASGPAPLVVIASASGSSDTDQTPIAQVIFNFGDGTIVTASSGRTATHVYTSPGTYVVSVAVIDTAHLSSTVSQAVTVS